jgi:hypothetical protein
MPGGDSPILSCLWLGEAGGLHWEQPSICFKCGLCIPKDRVVIEQGNKPRAITWPSIEYASVETDPGSSRLHLELTIGRLPAERLTAAVLARRLWSRFLDPEVIKQGLQEAKQREEIREKIRRQNIWGDKGTNPTDETK